MGSLAGKRDVHSLRAYATEESLQAKFPRKGAHELDLILLYPILDLLGNQTLNCSEYVSVWLQTELYTVYFRLFKVTQLDPVGQVTHMSFERVTMKLPGKRGWSLEKGFIDCRVWVMFQASNDDRDLGTWLGEYPNCNIQYQTHIQCVLHLFI